MQMVAWSGAVLDEITDEFLALMLDKREFIDRWTLSVEAEVARMQSEATSSTAALGTPTVDVTRREDTTQQTFEELVHAVDASSQTFLSSADLSICHCEPEHNRDASLLFAARLQIDRIASRKVDRQRYEAAARRLLQLVRLFTTRISSAFQISNISAFATSLCDMLYTFCDCTTGDAFKKEQDVVSELRRAADDFNEIVVEKLSKSAFEAQCARRNAAKPTRPQFFSPQPLHLRRPLVQIQHRSPGYLLTPEMQKKRQKIARTRSVPSMPSIYAAAALNSKKISSRSTVASALVAHRRENWNPSVEVNAATKKISAPLEKEQNEATIRLARKISSEVMKDLRRRYGNVDIGMLGV